MIKRLTGFVAGYLVGIASSWWLFRKVRARFVRYTPPSVASRVGQGVGTARRTVATAVTEGRDAMRRREAELRGDVTGAEPPRASRSVSTVSGA